VLWPLLMLGVARLGLPLCLPVVPIGGHDPRIGRTGAAPWGFVPNTKMRAGYRPRAVWEREFGSVKRRS
jgi:hypothetical protein